MTYKVGLFVVAVLLLLAALFLFGTPAQADGPPPGIDTAERDEVVPEDSGRGISGAEGGLPDIDTAKRDDWVLDVGEGGAYSTEGGLPGVDTAERDDVVPEEEAGTSGTEGILPDVDTAERDDVVPEGEGGTSGAEGVLPNVDTAERDDVVPEGDGGTSGAEGILPNVDTAERDDVVPEGGVKGTASTAPAPTGLKVTSDTYNSVSLSWKALTDAGGYKVEYRKGSTAKWLHAGYAGSSTTYTVAKLTCNTAYQFRVRARGDGSPYSFVYGTPSSSVSETTDACPAPAPTGLKVTSDTETSVTLSWKAVTNANGYKVEYRKGSAGKWLHAGYAGSRTTYTVTRLTCNTAYQFQVRARGDGSPYPFAYGDPSSSVSETTDTCPAPAPTGLKVTSATDDSVSLSWKVVKDASAYKVEYRKASTAEWLHAKYVFFASSTTVYSLKCNTGYQFRVRARGDGSPYSRITYGDPSSSVSETTDECLAPAPTGLKVTSQTQTSVSLSWKAVKDADAYKVEYRKSGSAKWLHATYVFSGTGARVGSLKCNTSYQFRVKARGDGSPYTTAYGDPSSSVTEKTVLCSPPAPTGLKATSHTDTGVTLSWKPVTDAAAYKVEYRKSGSLIWLHARYVFSGTSATVGSLSGKTKYEFRVRARGDGNPYSTLYGGPSSSVSETTDAPTITAPTGLKVTSDTRVSVSLRWKAVTDAGAYKIEYRKSDAEDWLHASYVYNSTSDTVDGLVCNTEYEFRVRARGDGDPFSYEYSSPSSPVTETTDECPPAPAPTGLKVTGATKNSVSLTWKLVPDAHRYKLERRKGTAGSWAEVGSEASGTSKTATGLECNTTYYFRVSTRGDGSPYSTTYGSPSTGSVPRTTSTCPAAPAPTGLKVTGATKDSVSLTWKPVTDAHRYKIERSLDGSTGWNTADTGAGSINATSYTVDGLTCNTTYHFRASTQGDGNPYSTSFGSPSTGSVSRKTNDCIKVFQFTPSPLALGGTSNVWTVPAGVTGVYVDVDFSIGSAKDGNSGDIDIHLVDSKGVVQSTKAVDRERNSGVVTGAKAGSLVRIDVDNSAFDSSAALVTLTFHSGSDETGTEIAKAKVQKESRPYSPVSGSATVDKVADSVTLKWKTGASRRGSKPDHYEVVIPGTTYSNRNVDDSKSPTKLTISNASTTLGAGKHTAEVSHCNAAGGCSLPLKVPFTVEGPNRPPSFSQSTYTFTIPEDSSIGDRVGIVSATDPNAGDTVTYSIVAGNSTGTFAMNANTGEITVAGALDFESKVSYALTVRAEDTVGTNTNVAATISITDVNERPTFKPTTYRVSIPEDATVGAVVDTVTTTDEDTGDTVSYSFLSGNSAGKFAIDGTTGKITLAASLDRAISKSYLLRIRARDSGGLTVYAPVTVTVDYALNIGSGEWGVFAYRRLVLDWIIPTSERSASHQFHLSVPASTGFQINAESALDANKCNWNSPPSANTPWSDSDESFVLVRCKLGTGTANITAWKRPATGAVRTSVKVLTLGPVEQAWHRADHRVGYLVGSPLVSDAKLAHLPASYTPDEATLKKAINKAVSSWNKAQSYVVFEAISTSPDTTIRGYWNPGTANDKCGGSIACVTTGTSKYPHLRHQPFWIEYPPQFPRDPAYKLWTNDSVMAKNNHRRYYYLPQVVMHEFGHIVGLGHSPGDDVMGAVDSTRPIVSPKSYDVDGVKNTYENHTKH